MHRVVRIPMTRASVAVALLGAAACSDPIQPTPKSMAGRASTQVSAPVSAQSRWRTLDDDFSEIADSAAGFGGLFLDESDQLVILTTGASHGDSLVSAIEAVRSDLLRPQTRDGLQPRIAFQSVEHDFRTLMNWRDIVRKSLWVPGITVSTSTRFRTAYEWA